MAAILPALLCSAAAADGPYELTRVYRVGQAQKYHLSVEAEGLAGRLAISLDTTDRVTQVGPDGSHEITSTADAGTLDVSGMQAPYPGIGQALTFVTAGKGDISLKDTADRPHRGEIGRLVGLTRIAFVPAGAVSDGAAREFSTQVGKRRITGTVTVIGLERAAGDAVTDTVKLHLAARVTDTAAAGMGTGTLEADLWIDPRNGILQRQKGSITGLKLPDLGPAKVSFARIRLPDVATGK